MQHHLTRWNFAIANMFVQHSMLVHVQVCAKVVVEVLDLDDTEVESIGVKGMCTKCRTMDPLASKGYLVGGHSFFMR